ncbi:MAG: hypothetical protein ACE37F_33610 [Nannocystaceae bacterium]|nr:SBBP repeat-containing protein [bacterium]
MNARAKFTSIASGLLLCVGCDAEGPALDEQPDTEPVQAPARPGADAIRPAPVDPVAAAEDCCVSGAAGCADVPVQACVCEADPYCCNTAWDSLCVGEVDSLGCGTCGSEVACCGTSGDPGCERPDTESCVCDADPYCCNVAWDSLCVSEVESLGCGSCGPVDLVISALTVPDEACLGEDIASRASLSVTNDGADPVSGTVGVAWYLSADTQWDATDRLLLGGRDQITGGMAAGVTRAVSLGVNQIPTSHATGPQYLLTVIDELDAVAERDELNNVMASPIELTESCSQPLSWFGGLGGPSFDRAPEGAAVAADGAGNVYVVGNTYGPSIDLGAGPQATQDSDAFVVSYDASGSYRWSRLISGPDYDNARGVAVDGSGDVFVLLESEGSLDAGAGLSTPMGDRDLLVASFDQTGAPLWSERFGAAGVSLLGHDLASNDAGDLVAVGVVLGSGAIDFGGGALAAGGGQDGFALGLTAAGGHRFSRRLAGSGSDGLHGAAVSDTGGALLVGSFDGTVDYGGGAMTSTGTGLDGLVMRVDVAGNTVWTEHHGGTGSVFARKVVVDASGNAYVTGTFGGSLTVGGVAMTASGLSDALLVAYDASGSVLWARQDGGSGLDYARGIALDTGGNLVTAGSFFGSPASYADTAVTGAGGYDLVLTGIRASDGAGLWADARGTSATEEGYDAIVTAAGSLVVTGTFAGTWTEAGTTLSPTGERDLFVLSIAP